MKSIRRMDSTSQSCSCTSCLYKSESEQPSIKKYVAHGPRIDRLYYGKYIPLRERKLLNRLVRTRAVYDDLRARLISDSTLSLEKNADLRPGKHHHAIKTLDSEKSGAILELVDIIDKGAALEPKKLSDCCSCCSCSSQSNILKRVKKEQKAKKNYVRTHEKEYVREFDKTVPWKTRERYNKRGVRFKAKHIRSDPCTCTFEFSNLIGKHSKPMLRKIHPLPLEEPFLDKEEQYMVENRKNQKFAIKYKNLREKLDQDIRKLRESKANMKKNLQLRTRKSLEQVKRVKNKIKNNVESSIRKSIQVVKELNPKDKTFEPIEYPEFETTFKIKKDSIAKFKEYLKRKEIMKDFECDLECEPDICVPEECFKILKIKRLRKRNRLPNNKYAAGYEMINREVKVGGAPLSRSDSGNQAKALAKTKSTRIKKQKPILRVEDRNQLIEKGLIYESAKVKKGGVKNKKNTQKLDKNSMMSVQREENALHEIKKKGHFHTNNETLKEGEIVLKQPHSGGRQAVRVKSSFTFDVEFYKNPQTSQSSQPSCIYMHAPRRKHKKNYHRHEPNVASMSSLESSQGRPENLKSRLIQTNDYVKAPITSQHGQIVSKISQCECEKRHSNVKTNTNYGTKSVSSITNNVTTVDKNISKEVKQKSRLSKVSLSLPVRVDTLTSGINESYSHRNQAVYIGSTCSFNIEFYKKDHKNEFKSPSIKEKVKKTRSKNRQVKRRLVQVRGTSAKAYNQAKTTLHRCFCTLKLRKHVKTKKKSTKVLVPSMIDKYVETKKNNRYEPLKQYNLLPYQCEPGVCVPDECDPIICKKILDLRKRRFRRTVSKSIGSYTGSRKTKSTSSITSRPFNSARAKTVQSVIVPTKRGSTNSTRWYENNFNLRRNELTKMNINPAERQAVRIGSSFSFNIEFYKFKQNPTPTITKKSSLSSVRPEIISKQQKFKENDDNKRNKYRFTQVMNMDKYVGPSLKRCLCTLKLYKNVIPKKKTFDKNIKQPANTQTVGEASVGELINKGTRTKKKHRYKLLPYECEPYICVPEKCDPYICLQKIKRRELNTRNVSALTDKPEMRSTSSFTENSFKKSGATLVQPKLLQKSTNMKADCFKILDGKPQPKGESLKASKSKQAVKIGSSFNFSIEFLKQLPDDVTLNKYPKIKQSPTVHSKINRKYKGITVTKVRVDHGHTQPLEQRKANRASLVRPILKRCFCTLNLQKKTKLQFHKDNQVSKYFGPKIYTVGRAMSTKTEIMSHSFGSQMNAKLQFIEPKTKLISISTSSFLLNKYLKSFKSKSSNIKLYSTIKIPIQLKEPVIMKSNLSMKLDIARQLGTSKESVVRYMKQTSETFSHVCTNEKSHECLNLFTQPSNHNPKKIMGISRYLERCFCTMNIQISKPGGIKNISNKLGPYECEPGLCIPGECDPYECKKIIMKRFAKYVHKSSGTNSKSISSYATSNAGLDFSTQVQPHLRSHSQVTTPQRYKSPRQRSTNEFKNRQAVRIKSSFSFDLEFYKHRSQPFKKYMKTNESSINIKTPLNPLRKDRQEKKIYGKETKIQVAAISVNKGTAPISKRCFCTLKLQKKGKIHREHAKLHSIPAKQQQSTTSRNVKIGTTTKSLKILFDSNDLTFYECEPGICIPGQCDPYKCVELMKHRKNLGVNTNVKEKSTVSSVTNEEKYKTRAINVIPLTTYHKSTKTIDYIKNTENNENPHISGRRERSAIRIGSNFSFNIEFSKDFPQTKEYKQINLQKKKTPRNDSKTMNVRKELKAIMSPSIKSVSHRRIVTEKPFHQEAAITASFTKRCFCTEKRRSVKFPDQLNTKTFRHKCFCLLGFRNKGNNTYQSTEELGLQSKENKNYQSDRKIDMRGKINKNYQPGRKPDTFGKRDRNHKFTDKVVQTARKSTNTNVGHKLYLPYLDRYLEPYECEPGVCLPGKCDPHLCEKLIQKRLVKQHSKKSEIRAIRKQVVSSSIGYHKQSKNKIIQAQGKTYKKQYTSKDIPPVRTMNSNADNSLVRIGSNLSFNIEFYKDNIDRSVIKEKIKEVKPYSNKDVQNRRTATENISKNIETKTVNIPRSKIKKKTKTSGVNLLLKRCFCTLKFKNKRIVQNDRLKKINQLDTKSIVTTKSVETQSNKRLKGYKLLQNDLEGEDISPYACEPFVCIPGQCDPVACFMRIKRKKQQTKDSGTITNYPKKKSIGNDAAKKRDENLQVKHPNAIPNRRVQKRNYVEKSWPENSYSRPRQAVRIESNFSFNIEFFKDIGNYPPKVVANRALEELNKNSQLHTKIQPTHFNHKVGTQVISTKLQSTETGTGNLKRCFCTLPNSKLKNPIINIQSDQAMSDHSTVGKFLKKCICTLKFNKVGKQQIQPPKPAVKYEIKGTSTHSQIKKPIRLLDPYECEPYFCVPGKCNPYDCLKRIQQKQVRHFGTDYKRNVKDSATDSIKQPVTRSIKAQYQQKRKLNSRGASLVSKNTRCNKKIVECSYDPSHNTNRQGVRIGSNFSFNVEFFKNHAAENKGNIKFKPKNMANIKTLQINQPEKPSTKSRSSMNAIKRLRDKKSQYSSPKRKITYTADNLGPKRCFCTLKFLKKPNNLNSEWKQSSHTIPTKDRMTATKNKYMSTIPQELGIYECPPLMCVPGECNPYKCLEKIKKREIMRKSRNVGTRADGISIVSVGNKPFNVKSHKFKSQVTKTLSEPKSEILKSTPIVENSNKRAVRIGSNFNFNIDFFKQKFDPAVIHIPKVAQARDNEEQSQSNVKKNVTAVTRNFGHSHMDDIKQKDQASDAGNLLKKCFCTLQIQKPTNHKMQRVTVSPRNNIRYPQTFTVGRVVVEPFLNTVGKTNQSKKVDKAKSKSIDGKFLNKTVGTKTEEKYLRYVEFPIAQCNPSICPDYQKRILNKNTAKDMQTILPFTPSKFNKKESRTLVPANNKSKKNHLPSQHTGKDVHKTNNISMFSKGGRLTAKKSKKSIPTNSLETKSNFKESFFCRCVRFFSRRSETRSEAFDKQENINNIIKLSRQYTTIRQPEKIKLTIPPKKAKSFSETCPFICPEYTKEIRNMYSNLQSGDAKTCKTEVRKKFKLNNNQSQNQRVGKFVTFADNLEYSKSNMFRKKTIKQSKCRTRSRLCYSCSVNNCPLNKLKADKKILHDCNVKNMKSNKNIVAYLESADDCQYCACCKRKIDTDEISKGGGDRRLSVSSQYKEDIDKCPCGTESVIKDNERLDKLCGKAKSDTFSEFFSVKKDKCCRKIKPLLEIRLDSRSHSIINKGELKEKISLLSIDKEKVEDTKSTQIKSKHKNICICCKCLQQREKQKCTISEVAKSGKNIISKFGNIFCKKNNVPTKPRKVPKRSPSRCICGSTICALESKRKRNGKLQKEKARFRKPCVCGSGICIAESKRIKRKKERCVNKVKRKAQSIIDKKERKAVKRRVKIQEEKDKMRRIKRIKRNRELEESVKKYKNASDLLLAIDSLADIGKLGISTLRGVLSYTTKSMIDPKVACERLCKKCRKKDPESLMKQLQKDYMESDAAATIRRLKMRCLFMKRVQSLRQKLEENPVSHFILHIADRNAKTRMFKRKPVRRVREPLDFQCSLYMATLRKKPYLSVYYKWPKFYPHFITMVNIWRQFTDIMLFLLAAVVWSPCILCMEGCRALMCCVFCTG